jgi:hypothetical protein
MSVAATVKIQFFLHFAQRALFWRFRALEKSGDQSIERSKCLRPCPIVRQHYHAIVLNHRRNNRRWIVVMSEAALRGTHPAHFALHCALDESLSTTRTVFVLRH